MIEKFTRNVEENNLFSVENKILIAVSGGVDSMVLLHLFEKSDFNYGVIHCNFQLRGDESDEDEKFVRSQTEMHGVPAHIKKFDTREYAKLGGISIEMAARELRYEYFEETRKKYQYTFVATAHHQDDVIETFFLNLSRKTGIKGLTGIKEKSGNIIRPLLFANRKEIVKYAWENDLQYREDSSNREIVFQRNFIRHKILPLFAELNPAFNKNVLASIQNLRETENVYSGFMQSEIQKVVQEKENELTIEIQKLLQTPFAKIIMFEILNQYNFNATVINEVFEGLNAESGKQYFSKTHRLVKDREFLFLSELAKSEERNYYVEEDDIELFEPFDIVIQKTKIQDFKMDVSPKTACIDYDLIQFPLLIRKWRKGDYFQPLGMDGFKKVSDYLIDEKIPLHEKENIWLLCFGKKIIWIMGYRLDNRFKITSETKRVLKIELK